MKDTSVFCLLPQETYYSLMSWPLMFPVFLCLVGEWVGGWEER